MKRTARNSPPIESITTEVRAVYRALEERPIERACTRRTECCQFKLTGRTPFLTKGEALVAASAYRRSGRTRLPSRSDGACPMMDATGNCIIYEDRPFGCRTHFCAAAGGPYGRQDVIDLIRRLEEIDHAVGGNGPHAIEAAVRSALAELS